MHQGTTYVGCSSLLCAVLLNIVQLQQGASHGFGWVPVKCVRVGTIPHCSTIVTNCFYCVMAFSVHCWALGIRITHCYSCVCWAGCSGCVWVVSVCDFQSWFYWSHPAASMDVARLKEVWSLISGNPREMEKVCSVYWLFLLSNLNFMWYYCYRSFIQLHSVSSVGFCILLEISLYVICCTITVNYWNDIMSSTFHFRCTQPLKDNPWPPQWLVWSASIMTHCTGTRG